MIIIWLLLSLHCYVRVGRRWLRARVCARARLHHLRVSVDHRKPRALDVHHEPVAAPERVEDVGQLEVDGGRLARHEGLGARE